MLLIVEAMKFRAFIVGITWGSSSTGGTMMMGTVRVEMFSGSAYEALSWND